MASHFQVIRGSGTHILAIACSGRLTVSLGEKVVYHAPRVRPDSETDPVGGLLTCDGLAGGFYISDSKHEDAPVTYASFW